MRDLKSEIAASGISSLFSHLNINEDELILFFISPLTTPEEVMLSSVLSAHEGTIVDTEEVVTPQVKTYPFSSKVLPDGKKLYAREHGMVPTTAVAGQSTSIQYMIPYAAAKITGAKIINCAIGDTAVFRVLDTDTGSVTTVPKYILNTFGIDVHMPAGEYSKQYSYDADLFYGLYVEVVYTNNGTEDREIYINLDLHEVK